MNDDGNILHFGSVKGGKEDKENKIPTNNYVVLDADNEQFFGSGFMIFTSHHLAIMRDEGDGAVPVLVLPISRVKAAELVEDDED